MPPYARPFALAVGAKLAVQNDRCALCRQEAKEFKDELSKKEFRISGMCQACQDKVFSEDEDE